MTRDPQHKKPKKSLMRRLVRFLLWTAAALFILFIVLIAGILLYFTPERIESIAEETASKQLQQKLTFTNAHFNLLNGFVFEDIVLSPPDSSVQTTMLPVHSATAKEVSFRYSLRHIFKRQFVITSAVIDSPQVYVVINPTEILPQATKVDTAQEQSDFSQQQDQAAIESFLAVELQKFRLKNASITVDRQDSLQQQHIYLSDLSMSLDDVSAPRGNLVAQDSLLRADFSLECRNSTFIFDQITAGQQLSFSAELDAQLDVLVSGLSSIQIDGFGELNEITATLNDQFSLNPTDFSMPLLVNAQGDINAKAGTARFERISFNVDEVPWIACAVQADSVLSTPFITVDVFASRIPIQQLITMAQPFVPADVMPSIYLHNANSHLSLAGTTISGAIPSDSTDVLNCQINLSWLDFGTTLNKNEHFLKNFNVDASVHALLGLKGVEQPTARVSVSYDSVFITTADGQKVFSGPASFSAETDLNAAFFPTRVQSDLSMSNLLGSDIHGDLSLTSAGGIGSIRGTGDFSLNNIDISPFTQSQILSRVSVDATLALNSLNDLVVKTDVKTDSITIVQEFDNIVFSPINLKAEFKGASDTLFQNFAVRSLTASMNDIVNAELTGKGSLSPEMQVDLNHLFVSCDLASALAWVPNSLKAPVANTKVSGMLTLNSNFHGRLTQADTVYNGGIFLETKDVNINYENGLAQLTDVDLNINGRINSQDSAWLALDFGIAAAQSNTLPDKVFRDNNVRLKVSMPDFSIVRIDTGLIQFPDLKTNGDIGGLVKLVNNVPFIDAHVKLTQNAADTIRLLPDIYYRGRNDIEINIRSDSSRADIAASIRTTDLTVSLPQNIRVDRINTNISLQQIIDLKKGTIIASPQATIDTPSDGLIDYRLYRDYYYQPDKNPSYIDIRRAVVGDYLVENIHAEMFIGAGAVEIPAFSMNAYGGNIGGSFSLISDIENMLESSYRLSAHMSGINSALLLPSLEGKSKGTLKAHTELTGKGFDIIKGIDLDGYFNITEIESKVAGNLLTLLDPEGKDTGIKITRTLLDTGYKPRLMTFDIQHGYCYPAIFFDQPWYFPVKLSGSSIEFARIPIAALMSMNN